MEERKLIPVPDKEGVFYADEDTKVRYETAQEALRVAAQLPPAGLELTTWPVTFDADDEVRGLSAVFAVGPVNFSGREDVVLVSDRTLEVLKRLGISYHIVNFDLPQLDDTDE